jgi:ABC-type thiamine transport system substrate-binding protein
MTSSKTGRGVFLVSLTLLGEEKFYFLWLTLKQKEKQMKGGQE